MGREQIASQSSNPKNWGAHQNWDAQPDRPAPANTPVPSQHPTTLSSPTAPRSKQPPQTHRGQTTSHLSPSHTSMGGNSSLSPPRTSWLPQSQTQHGRPPKPGCAGTLARATHLLGDTSVLGGGRSTQVLVHAVQQPEQELEGVVLRVAPELRTVLGDDVLQETGREGAEPGTNEWQVH